MTRRTIPKRPLFVPEDLERPIDWSTLFRTPGEVEIEVGCGKGRFLLGRAESEPHRNFIGIEYARAYILWLDERTATRGLTNLRISRCEAGWFFRECIADASISAFHLLYPDPWPKTRHHKRRLIQDSFLADLRRTLKPGGEINIATDHQDYFEWMLEAFGRWKGTFVMTARVLSSPEELKTHSGRTNYETKYAAEGRSLHFLTGHRTGF